MSLLICHLCHFSPDVPGTFLDGVLRLATVAARRLQAHTIFVLPEAARERRWLVRLDNSAVPYFCTAPGGVRQALAPSIEAHDTVILHSHFTGYDLAACRLSISNRRKFRTIVHLHSEASVSAKQALKDMVKMRMLGRYFYDAFIAVSDNVEANILARGVPQDKVHLVRNAVAVDRFVYNSEQRRQARAAFGFKDQDTVVLLLGWDPHRKGVDLFLEAAAAVGQRANSVVFCITGQEATKQFAANHPCGSALRDSLRILEPVEDFAALLNAVDIFVSASRREGLPYAVLEAMATEKLVIASEIEGVSRSYGMAEGVWLFPVGDAPRLTELTGRAVEKTEQERRALGRLNRVFVEANFSLEPWADRIVGIYEGLLEGR
jgi:glycosyltransferase involved in cell wall biosynthesis